jgi:hypothetical protein
MKIEQPKKYHCCECGDIIEGVPCFAGGLKLCKRCFKYYGHNLATMGVKK